MSLSVHLALSSPAGGSLRSGPVPPFSGRGMGGPAWLPPTPPPWGRGRGYRLQDSSAGGGNGGVRTKASGPPLSPANTPRGPRCPGPPVTPSKPSQVSRAPHYPP